MASTRKRKKKRPLSDLMGKWHRVIVLVLGALLLFSVLFSIYRSNMTFKTTEYTVESPFLPNAFNNYRIAQISDLHDNVFGQDGSKLLEAIDEAEPNIVVLTGDIVSRRTQNTDAVIDELKPIAEKYPTYYIRGNHELYRDQSMENAEAFYKDLDAIGVIRLENRTVTLMHREATIRLVGLMEPLGCYEYSSPPKMDELLGEKGDGYTVLLAHNPLPFQTYVDWGADLILSGHVHGGVIRLPFIGGLLSPERSFFPAYSKGVYQSGKQSMVVSTGMGGPRFPFRLFNDQELVVVTLTSQSIH
ncbi:metallophosphoesterase [Murdochiella massiliensis]|uniref:metallophosphoesterase n=1 Tax=Murdochiella massiliensis TaxID=1673723 RepID=UPI00082AECE1|nr:metallophosphoesterase [Murdochiella massiliensis]